MKRLKIVFIAIWICLSIGFPVLGQNNISKNLKAILIVGSHQESRAKRTIAEIDKIANLFIEKGVFVYKFYDKNANWNEIVKVSKDCNFFVYSGHGSTLGENGNAGGICINSMISTSDLLADLKLKDNSLVLFKYVCYGAGSSAGDKGDIGITEAKKRVTYYAYPFFEIGASAYYANNYAHGVYDFLNDFFSGIALKQAYLNSSKMSTDVEFDEPFPRDHNKSYSIGSWPKGGIREAYVEQVKNPKKYVIAYVGNPEFSIEDMK